MIMFETITGLMMFLGWMISCSELIPMMDCSRFLSFLIGMTIVVIGGILFCLPFILVEKMSIR